MLARYWKAFSSCSCSTTGGHIPLGLPVSERCCVGASLVDKIGMKALVSSRPNPAIAGMLISSPSSSQGKQLQTSDKISVIGHLKSTAPSLANTVWVCRQQPKGTDQPNEAQHPRHTFNQRLRLSLADAKRTNPVARGTPPRWTTSVQNYNYKPVRPRNHVLRPPAHMRRRATRKARPQEGPRIPASYQKPSTALAMTRECSPLPTTIPWPPQSQPPIHSLLAVSEPTAHSPHS